MTREKYTIILPVLLIVIIASAFLLSVFFSGLKAQFYLAYAVIGGAVVLLIDHRVRKQVTEPLSDERLQGIAEKSLWMAWRIGMPVLMIGGFVLMYGFSSRTELKFLGMGAVLSVALLSLVYSVICSVRQRRN